MFNQVNDLKSLRMEIALALQHKAKTEDIYEILDAGLLRATEITEQSHLWPEDGWTGERKEIVIGPFLSVGVKGKELGQHFLIPKPLYDWLDLTRAFKSQGYCNNCGSGEGDWSDPLPNNYRHPRNDESSP